jgi:hypothetical protein
VFNIARGVFQQHDGACAGGSGARLDGDVIAGGRTCLRADQRSKITMTTSIDRNGSVARRMAAVVVAVRLVVVACLIAFVGGAPAPVAAPAVARVTAAAVAPRNAIDGILDAFAEYDVVVLGEGPHGNEPGQRLRVSLIRDPRFTARVGDIVVEFGNARYQEVMDRYLAGEDVPRESLRRVWRDTTVPAPWPQRPPTL